MSGHAPRLWIVFAALFIGLAGCSPTEKTRVRITATVAIGDTIYRGSAVQEFRCKAGGTLGGGMDVGGCLIKGEAVYVDLKGHGNLVIPMLGKRKDATSYAKLIRPQSGPPGEAWELYGDAIPMMVTFTDPSDPRTVELVDPANLQGRFGQDARVAGLTAEKTSDAVTETLVTYMPWVSQGKGRDYLKRGQPGINNISTLGSMQRYDFKSKG